MKLSFVKADETDIPVVFAQAKELIDTYEDIASIDYERVLTWIQCKITQNISQYVCVRAEGEKCAYFRLCEDGELDDLYVLPHYRSKGIGSQILGQCIQESEKDIYLYVFRGNTRAIAFYERFGFCVRESVGNTRLIMVRKG